MNKHNLVFTLILNIIAVTLFFIDTQIAFLGEPAIYFLWTVPLFSNIALLRNYLLRKKNIA